MGKKRMGNIDTAENSNNTAPAGAWWTVNDLIAYLGISRATVWRWASSETHRPEGFPKPAQLSNKIYRWKAGDVIAWAEGLAA